MTRAPADRSRRHLSLGLAFVLACAGSALGQTSSGTIIGRVLDSSSQTVPGATVTLTRQDTGETRTFVSNETGEFVFTALQPGMYDLSADLQGFKRYEQKGLSLSSSERLSAGDVKLEVGSISESVFVKADIAPVQSVSSERSALLDAKQVANLVSRGRDVMAFLTVLPGVVSDSEGTESLGSFNAPDSVSGARGRFSGMNIDGISGNVRDGQRLDTPINLDAIEEVKVLMNTYQAEYGKGSGAIINVVSKTGTQNLKGAAYDYVRDGALNANTFFHNRQGIPKGPYHYNTLGYNLGGPVLLPGFSANDSRLFFFFSQELLHNVQPNGPRNYTVPTALERQGDFSQSINVNSLKPITVRDPQTGRAFPGNTIPADRINASFQKLLNIFPLPNVTPDAQHHYNFQIADSLDRPVKQEILRLDYNFSSNLRAWFRITDLSSHEKGLASTENKFAWGIGPMDYQTGGPNIGGNLTWIINPTLVNELTIGRADWYENQVMDPSVLAKAQRANLGVSLGQLYPAANPLGLIPAMSFGGITSAATTSYDSRFPLLDDANSWSFTDSLSKVWREHQFKVGIQAERVIYNQFHAGTANFGGSFNFGTSNTFPADSGYAYANALLGNFQSYTESTARPNYSPITRILEWYAQDSWRALPRLTLDLGVRFTAGLPQISKGHFASAFVPSLYDPGKAPVLYRPGFDAQGSKAAIDPRCPTTCAPQNPALIGFLVPGSGDQLDGIVKSGTPGYPDGLIDFQGILPAPRLGFAWDVTGDRRTAVRGGFGVNYNTRAGSGILGDSTSNPPQVYDTQQFFGSAASYLDVGTLQAPPKVNLTVNRNSPLPKNYNTSIGVQREIGWATTVDVAYVASFGRDIGQKRNINQVPPGARFLPQNQDPTTGRPLSDNFLRPYRAFGDINVLTFDGTSTYNSLQTQVNHRFSNHLQFGVAYTWSRALAYTNGDQGNVAANILPRLWNYGLADYDRPHNLAINYVIELPHARWVGTSALARGVFDGWMLTGTTRFVSGAPLRWGQTTKAGDSDSGLGNNNSIPSTDWTGGGDAWRPVLVGNPELPAGQRTFDHWFNTAAFARPTFGTYGNAGPVVARGPGINNWNLGLFKNFDVGGRARVTLRAEAYNLLNHTQFRYIDTSPQFDAQGDQVNQTFGQAMTARDPRIMQFALRVTF